MQDSDIKGQRHLNSKTREAEEGRKRSEAFRRVLLGKLPKGHPLVRQAEEDGLL